MAGITIADYISHIGSWFETDIYSVCGLETNQYFMRHMVHSTSVEDDIRILALITMRTSAFHSMMLDLIGQVIYLNDIIGIPNSLDAKLSSALNAVDEVYEKNKGAAINNLQAFIKTVEAQRDKHIPDDYADALIEEVQDIIDMLSLQLAISNSALARSTRKNH